MAGATQISLEEYWQTSYRPDCEYIDGEVSERNVGTWLHARTITLLAGWFGAREQAWGCVGAIAVRIPISSTRVRVPDLVLFSASQDVQTKPPFLVVEVLSPNDTDTQQRTADYYGTGVENVWTIDPITRTGSMGINTPSRSTDRLEVSDTPIHVHLQTLFASLHGLGA